MVDIVFSEHWGEITGLIVFIIAVLAALSTANTWTAYGAAFVLGAMLGRMWYRSRKNARTPGVVIIAGAVLGLVLGNFFGNVSGIVISLFVGMGAAYALHKHGLVESAEY